MVANGGVGVGNGCADAKAAFSINDAQGQDPVVNQKLFRHFGLPRASSSVK